MTGFDLHLDKSLGAILIGEILCTMLYGFSIGQFLYYLRHYPQDNRRLKGLVIFLSVLDTVRNILNIQGIWVDLIQDRTAILLLLKGFPKASLASHFLTGVIILIVQSFFLARIWGLLEGTKYRMILTCSAFVTALATFGGIADSVYELTRLSLDLRQGNASYIPPIIVAMSSCLVTDIYITAGLSVILHKSRTGMPSTENMLSLLVRYTVERGLILLVIQLIFIGILVYSIVDHNEMSSAIFYPAGSIYVNMLFAILNVRQHIRDQSMKSSGEHITNV